MKAKHRFTKMVKALIESEILVGRDTGVADVPLARPIIISGLGTSWPASLLYADYAAKSVELDRQDVPEIQKYFQLLCLGFQEVNTFYAQKGQRKMSDLDFINSLNAKIEESVDKDDRLFAFMYNLSEGVLSEQERKDLWDRVMKEETSASDACLELKLAAFKKFVTTENDEVKKNCTRMVMAYVVYTTDLHEIDQASNFDENGNSDFSEYMYYTGRSFTNPEYGSYRKTLETLNSEEMRKKLPEHMAGMFRALVYKANELYKDDEESEQTKADCHVLMTKMEEYGEKYKSVTFRMQQLGYTTKSDIPESDAITLSEVNELEALATKINTSIINVSAGTTSKRWGVIALFAGLIIALGAITSGLAIAFGFGEMMKSLHGDSEFFKSKKKHYDVVEQSREIMKITDPYRLNLTSPEDSSAARSVPAEEVEMGPIRKPDEGAGRVR